MRLRQHYQSHLSKLVAGKLCLYIVGAQQFYAILCEASVLSQLLNDVLDISHAAEDPAKNYEATEFGAIFMMRLED
jgi:hypothetical protein